MVRPKPGIRTPEQVAERLSSDPAAREVLAIAEWAEELRNLCDEWLAGREAQAEARSELAQAREYRAETELSRGGRHAS
ncbi:hypothetical protein GOACH_35_00070 [Gordonia aichiensis NBRC 108223]|uniref:Uncharacterized protein n=1 Tax=Gordonia aichiensis NBRC 108223 TaxID=1220583 RepID=L7KQ38_9ACTN|nr:hypothetical protein GOACH_35_00070 [Gordonia aichiensis NBRC 108223]